MTHSSTASNENLTERLKLFGLVGSSVSVLGVLVHVLSVTVIVGPQFVLSPALYVQLAGCLCPLSAYLLCMSPRSTRFCRVLETVSLVGSAMSLTLMAQFLSRMGLPDLTGASAKAAEVFLETNQERFSVLAAYATSMLYILRSALVPSRTRWSVILGMLIGATVLLGPVCPFHASTTASAFRVAVSTFALWLLAVAVSAALTAVIHGLRREIARARKLGQYTLGEKIGEGGMGTVYRATHAFLRRPTAVKLLQEDRAGDVAIKRFEREVQLTAELTHPHTITIYDYGRTPDGVFYYAMELLDGTTLQSIVDAEGAQPEARVVHIMRMVAGALAEAHGRGLIHRDIKPANIMLGERGGVGDFATVLDFGLVREMTDTSAPELTSAGVVVGTPMYLAPELIKAQPASAASDIYALGGVAYLMLTGKTVFDGETVVEICADHLHTPVIPPSQMLGKPVTEGLEALILQCLEKDPSSRPKSAKDLVRALDQLAPRIAMTESA